MHDAVVLYQRTIHIKSYSVDQSELVAEPYLLRLFHQFLLLVLVGLLRKLGLRNRQLIGRHCMTACI